MLLQKIWASNFNSQGNKKVTRNKNYGTKQQMQRRRKQQHTDVGYRRLKLTFFSHMDSFLFCFIFCYHFSPHSKPNLISNHQVQVTPADSFYFYVRDKLLILIQSTLKKNSKLHKPNTWRKNDLPFAFSHRFAIVLQYLMVTIMSYDHD